MDSNNTKTNKEYQFFAAYIRVSTAEQAKTGVSAKAQEKAILDFAKLHSIGPIKFYKDEGISSSIKIKNRPSGSKMIKDINDGKVKSILFTAIDRGFRNIAEMDGMIREWQKKNVGLRILNFMGGNEFNSNDPMQTVFLTMLGAFAQLEKQMSYNRTLDGINSIKKNIKKDGFHIVKKNDGTTKKIYRLGASEESLEEGRKIWKNKAQEMKTARAALITPYFIQAIEKAKKRRPVPIFNGKIPKDVVFHEFRQIPRLLVPQLSVRQNDKNLTFDDAGRPCTPARDISSTTIERIFFECVNEGFLDEDRLKVSTT